jgi:predicted permease
MTSPRWARALLLFVAPPGEAEDVVGDFEESHRIRVQTRGRLLARLLSGIEALDLAASILWTRIRHPGPAARSPADAGEENVLSGIGVSWLDFKLGLRMLLKHPGLTLVAGIAMAFAIALGVGTYDFFAKMTSPEMPFEDGDRIYSLHNRNLRTGSEDPRALHDFARWREELRSFEEIGAYHSFQRNLSGDRESSSVRLGAAVTPEMLSIPRVPPLLGRLFSEADEIAGAPEVVLLGYQVWRTQLASDPEVVGTTVYLGSTRATVVGVMPEGYGWPRAYELWTPLRLDASDYERGGGPSIAIAGRLADHASPSEARAELAAIGRRSATDHPASHALLRPEMIPFGAERLPVSGVTWAFLYSLGTLTFVVLMLLVCGNVGLLLFARTAAREGELVVRSALGASRGRIVTQLFVEALVLAGLSTAIGLWGAKAGVDWVVATMEGLGEGQLGFWFDGPLSSGTSAIAAMIAVIAASITGALPALKVTGRQAGTHLQRVGAGPGVDFGRRWTLVIVAQIALTVVFVPLVVLLGYQAGEIRTAVYGFPAEEYLAVEVAMGGRQITVVENLSGGLTGDGTDGDLTAASQELGRRLREEPAVAALAFASQVPGAHHDWEFIEVDGPSAPHGSVIGHRVREASVDADFLDVLGARMVAGRGFDAADQETDRRLAIVNEDFARVVLEDRSAVGRRFRVRDRARTESAEDRWGPWYEIVGVIEQIAMTIDPEAETMAGFYVLLAEALPQPVRMVIRVGQEPERMAPRVRALAAAVDRNLLVTDVRPLDDSAWRALATYAAGFWVVFGAGGIGLLLATVGIYSIMSFTVSRRTREIGVRVALGAGRGRVVRAILAHGIRQISLGIACGGVVLAALVGYFIHEEAATPTVGHGLLFFGYLGIMTLVCGLACAVPTARALRVEPTVALRAEG